MLRVCLLFSLVALSSAVTFKNSVVFTSADIPVNVQQTLNALYPGTLYRVYATYASGSNYAYAQNVWIQDANKRYLLSELAQPRAGSDYILDETVLLRAPLTIYDGNTAENRVPFTFYIVDSFIITYPVASAKDVGGKIDSQNGYWAAGITVLSAEKYFTISNFDIGSFPDMYISSVGFDEFSSDYRLMYIGSSSQAKISFLPVYGPIVTLFNSNLGNSRFQFQFMKNTKYDYTLSPGAAFALLSPGYLSTYSSYNIPYQVTEAYDQAFTWGDSNWIDVNIQARNVNPSSILFRFTSSGGDNRDYTSTTEEVNPDKSYQEAYGNRISFKVTTNGNTNLKFIYKITSGSSLSFSLLGALIVAWFSKFH